MRPTNKKIKNPINQAIADSSGEDFWDYCTYNVRWYRMSRQNRGEKSSIKKEETGARTPNLEAKQIMVEEASAAPKLSFCLINLK